MNTLNKVYLFKKKNNYQSVIHKTNILSKSCHLLIRKKKYLRAMKHSNDKMASHRLLISMMWLFGSSLNTRCSEDQLTHECEQQSSNEIKNNGGTSMTSTDTETTKYDTTSEEYNYECSMISDEYFFHGTSEKDDRHKKNLKQLKWTECCLNPIKYHELIVNDHNGQIKDEDYLSSTSQQAESCSKKDAYYSHRRRRILTYLMNFIISINNDYMVKCNKQYDILYDIVKNLYSQIIELSHVVIGNNLPTIRNNLERQLAELEISTGNIYCNIDIIRMRMHKINKTVHDSFMLCCNGQRWSMKIDQFVVENMPKFACHIAKRQYFLNTWLRSINLSLKMLSNQPDGNVSNAESDMPCVENFKSALERLNVHMENIIRCNNGFISALNEGSLFLDRIERCIPSVTITID